MINKLYNIVTPINKVGSTKVHNNITFGENKALFITVLRETQKNFSKQFSLVHVPRHPKFKKAYYLDISLNKNYSKLTIEFDKNTLSYTKNLTIIEKRKI